MGRALVTSGLPALGVWLGGLLVRGFSWGEPYPESDRAYWTVLALSQ